ncbi:MAG: hypothetical protein Q9O24_07615 [Gammaproteobacteria bacterium]|nr:hypothetical protein [Gammaproteobacteria bacterium]
MLKTIALIGLALPLSVNATDQTAGHTPDSNAEMKNKIAPMQATPMEPEKRKKMFNLRLQPLNFALGGLGLDAEIKLFERFTLSGTYSSYDFDVTDSRTNLDFNIKATGYGVRANWYPSGAFSDSTYISPLIQTASIDIVDGDFSGSTDVTSYGILFGNQWMWDSINLNLAAGYSLSQLEDITLRSPIGGVKLKNSSDIPAGGFLAEFSLGFAF